MAYDLRSIALRATKIRRQVTIARIIPSKAQAIPYAVALLAIPDAWAASVTARVLPAYDRALATRRRTLGITADTADDLGAELAQAEEEVGVLTLSVTPKMKGYAVAIEQWHRSAWVARIKSALGLDMASIVGATGAEETIAAFYERNLGLISSISDEMKRRIGQTIWSGYEQLTPRDEIARQLVEQTDLTRARARRIAIDQTTKLSASLDQQRQREAGIVVYKWRHSRKLRPRIEHVARDGKLFSWDKPPADGPPGTLPFCGCHAEATLDLTADSAETRGVVAA